MWAGNRVWVRGEQSRKDRKLLSSVSPPSWGGSTALWLEPNQAFTTQGFSYQGKPQLSGAGRNPGPPWALFSGPHL